MTTTTQQSSTDAHAGVDGEPGPDQIAPPPKYRRRPLLVIASVAAVALGALASVWAYQGASDANDVLAVRTTVERGQVIEPDDLMTVPMTIDPALHPLPASQLDVVVGKRAALDLVAGGVVTADQVTETALPAAGMSVVGLNLTASALPANQVRVGDRVRVVLTSDPVTGTGSTPEEPVAIDAEVAGSGIDDASGNTILNVQVAHDDAPLVADKAAAGQVAVVLDEPGDQE
ncbi:SAF domain-containing protein [Isoptericola sp. S6320L]|uniref:SAF domain-containing protein n=1 Tax=Isoptericola sp. S6320L TaxID=2926411 RepID=UPI001FF2A95A|nr:SAF domain-containing protein [Isoptericola sp. S6320L]MCK0116986.1 SAF domain-containing protein [Isoptericola sp. S6320L]